MNLSSPIVRTNVLFIGLFTCLVLILLVLLTSQLGAVQVDFSDWASLLNHGWDTQSGSSYVLWQLRLPRIVFALLIGSALGLSGALTQGLFRNPLADPGLLGVSAGAACAVALGIVLFSDLNIPLVPEWRFWTIPALAFSGAILVCFALDRIARVSDFSRKSHSNNCQRRWDLDDAVIVFRVSSFSIATEPSLWFCLGQGSKCLEPLEQFGCER
jgi:iron complex transport system permease protein